MNDLAGMTGSRQADLSFVTELDIRELLCGQTEGRRDVLSSCTARLACLHSARH